MSDRFLPGWYILPLALLGLVFWISLGAMAFGQTATGAAASGSASKAASLSAAQGGNVTFNNPGETRATYGGSYDLRNVPAVSPPGFGSGHPCALTPFSAGAGIVGYGLSAGGQIVDDACLLAQMGNSAAATYIIAARNPAACRALVKAGTISASSKCGKLPRELRLPTDQPVATTSTKSALFRKCYRDDAGKIRMTLTNAGRADKTAAANACRSSL